MDKLMQEIEQFNAERDWDQFHSPENLAKSIAIESGELLECFQWNSENYNKEEVCEELADVFRNNEKYPVEKAKGVSTKYNKL